MNKINTITLSVILLLMITSVSFWFIQKISKPRILVLHSYDTNFSWVNNINIGLTRILETQNYTVRYHYMDTKRHTDKDFKEKAGIAARNMIDDWLPNIIIAVDDNAQEYVSRYYINHPNISIVFTGVNKEAENYGYDQANNVTGVLERINYKAVKEVLLKLLPENKRKIVHISDASPTSEGIRAEIENFDWSPLQFYNSIQTNTFDEWKAAITQAETAADIVLYTHYHTIRHDNNPNSSNIDPKEIMEWTAANSNLPGVSFWGFYVEDGGMMAIALSPYEQGELAAKMAVDIINNKRSAKNIPIQTGKLFIMYMRDSVIQDKMQDFNLPLIYEAFSKIIHQDYP